MYQYKTHGTCSRAIEYDIENGTLKNVKFIGGCNGNLQGIAKLVEGRPVSEVVSLLSGINCRNNTSCPDQLANALKKHL